jgi:hypothetical protein
VTKPFVLFVENVETFTSTILDKHWYKISHFCLPFGRHKGSKNLFENKIVEKFGY